MKAKPQVSALRGRKPDDLAANEVGCGRISLRCASMRRKIALNSPAIRGMSDKGKGTPMRIPKNVLLAAMLGLGLSAATAEAAAIFPYFQTNLVSDLSGVAAVQDLNLKNPWGVSESATSPLWISDQAANVATLYTINGLTATPAGGTPPLVVPIPPSGGPGPTGQVNNSTTSFVIPQNGAPSTAAHFIFANLNGTISAWAAAATPAAIEVTTPGASYTGLAIGSTPSLGPLLYAANNVVGGGINVFNGSFAPVSLGATAFLNPFPGLVPFNVQNIGGDIYVTYAVPGHGAQTTASTGSGGVAVYDQSGFLISALITGSDLASPWGIALAPAGFGPFGGDLLVGNFAYGTVNGMVNPGGGEINAYNPVTGAFLATLDSNPAWEGLWALTFGNGGNGGNGGASDILYFTTGLNSEHDGLLAALAVVPEPSTLALLGFGILSVFGLRLRAARRSG
jgi:uncharacterized protein (TIGR03118 family)